MMDAVSAVNDGEHPWLRFERGTPPLEAGPAPRVSYNLFANTTIYLFMRLVQIIYERLREVKSYEKIVAKELAASRSTTFAKDLHLYDTKLEKLGLLLGHDHCYEQVLGLCQKQIEGELEPQFFEEALRQGYRNRAYKLYTIDKAINGLVKQLHALVTDTTTGSVLLSFEEDRRSRDTDVKKQILYRMKVRQLLGAEEAMFRIDWNEQSKALSFQHLGSYDLSLKNVAEAQNKWDYYVTSYMMSVPTEGIPFERIKPPLLSRATSEDVSAQEPLTVVSQGLSARICMNTYKLFFEPGTVDYFVRKVPNKLELYRSASERRAKRWEELKQEMDLSDGFRFQEWLDSNGDEPAPEPAPAPVEQAEAEKPQPPAEDNAPSTEGSKDVQDEKAPAPEESAPAEKPSSPPAAQEKEAETIDVPNDEFEPETSNVRSEVAEPSVREEAEPTTERAEEEKMEVDS